MSQPTNGSSAETIVPAVDLQFIQNQTGIPEDAGLEEIEHYHRALFLHHHARDIERFEQQCRLHEDRLAHLNTRLIDTNTKLAGIDRLLPVSVDGQPDIQPTAPWNFWDAAMSAAAALGIAALLIFGILNVSFNLLESGLVTFMDHPVRAYFWAALLPVGALAVKVGWDCLESRRKREIFLWSCLCTGIAGVLVWLAAYAAVYPTLSKSTDEQIAALKVFDAGSNRNGFLSGTTSAGAKWIDVTIVAAQAVAEIFLSAVLGMYLTMLYQRHRPVRLAQNPLFSQLDQERQQLETVVAHERLAFAEAKGNRVRLDNQLAALVAYAKAMFQKEATLQRDECRQKRIALDQISEQLRTQLQAAQFAECADPRATNGST